MITVPFSDQGKAVSFSVANDLLVSDFDILIPWDTNIVQEDIVIFEFRNQSPIGVPQIWV